MSKYVTGSRRLKIIQQYLSGNENPDYEVLPTKKEGKFIVKKREIPLAKQDGDDVSVSSNVNDSSNENHETIKPTVNVDNEPKLLTKPVDKPTTNYNAYDPTISLEILNQLKSLGEELRSEREAKQQKRLIKATVRDQMYKQSSAMSTLSKNESECYKHERSESSDDEHSSSANQIIMQAPPKPIYVRRKLNLLKR